MAYEDLSAYNAEGTTLRKAQLRMLDMLIAFDKVCRNNNIPYWLEYGSLIGAVRHKGFIPWDDDIDVSVLEEDKDRLRECLLRELPDYLAYQDSTVDPCAFFPYARLRDKKSYCYYPHFVNLKEQGLWLDIFYYSVIHSSSFKNKVDALYRRTFREIHHYGDVEYKSTFKRLFNRSVAYLLHPISLLLKSTNSFLGKRKKNRSYGVYAISKHLFSHDEIFPLSEIEFEGHKFMAPADVDRHLRNIYGEYMKVPPVEKRRHMLDLDKIEFYE